MIECAEYMRPDVRCSDLCPGDMVFLNGRAQFIADNGHLLLNTDRHGPGGSMLYFMHRDGVKFWFLHADLHCTAFRVEQSDPQFYLVARAAEMVI